MDWAWVTGLSALAYLTGAIPTAVWLGRMLYGTDVRKHGSGNAGATNTFRTLGAKAGLVVLLVDLLKGTLAANYGNIFAGLGPVPEFFPSYLPLLLGLSATVGHIYPVYAGFKGGKGVATLFGVVIGIDWLVALICLGVFLLVFLLRRTVSLASMVSGLAFTAAYILLRNPYDFTENVLAGILPLLIIFTHRANIARLLKGEEPRFSLKSNKK